MNTLIYCVFLFFLIIKICNGVPYQQSNICGYQSCNLGKSDKLNVHLVAHTHDDVGWLKTVEEYFYGARNDIQRAGVQYIIDSVIQSLLENPDRRFIYVEIAFFWRWWMQQTKNMQFQVKQLVNEGRLEFISGGWCMQDEATTHYNSIIDQHSLGAEFLQNEFGECARPKIGWQIDPFGHSREVASLFAQMGFDGLFFGKFDYRDFEHRTATKTLELLWKGDPNLDRQSWLFTSILPHIYSPPNGFCFDLSCQDEPIMDNPNLHDYNVPERVQAFFEAAHEQADMYVTNHILMTMGSDFQYGDANAWFKNLDKLIKYVNEQQSNGSDVNVFYSTPSCYLYAVNQANRTWTSKTDDFFPYTMRPHLVRTGFYTSRPSSKLYERYSNNILQVTRQLNAFSNINMRNSIFPLNDALGIMQHHDAISGTEQQHVADDYIQRLSDGLNAALIVINNAYGKLFPKQNQSLPIPTHQFCQLLNISQCLPIEKQDYFTLTLWNPTIHTVTNFLRVPITNDYKIIDPTGQTVLSQILPIPTTILNIPGRISLAQNEILFKAILPPLGFNTYYFQNKNQFKPKLEITYNDQCTLRNQFVEVLFDNNGNLLAMKNLKSNISVSFSNQGLYWYHSFPNGSGPYVFRPLTSTPQPLSETRNITCTKSDLVQSALIIFNEWGSQQINIYDNLSTIEIQWTVGPIPIDDNIGKDVIIRYDTDINSQSKYYTDANGRQVLERIRNYRPTWNFTVMENVSENYYPINSRIWINDQQRQFTLLTDRSHGGASIHDGSVEIMVHRRIPNSDPSSGMKEPLNETAYGKGLVVHGKHLIIFDTPSNSVSAHRIASQQFYMQPIPTFSLVNISYANYTNLYRQTWSALVDTMPANLHLLTLDHLSPKQYLIRIEHYFELNEDKVYSKPIQVDLQQLFYSLGQIKNFTELILTGNMPLDQLNRLNWTTIHEETNKLIHSRIKDTNITLNPMQIRTFQGFTINRVTVSKRDIVKLILDFLQQRALYISMLDIERETGIINGSYSEDILFLRQLILDGQWDDVIDFVQPLRTIEIFDVKQFIYIVLKYQFLELLCLKTESQVENDVSIEQIVKFLNDLHSFAPNEQEYKKLSFLLTLKRLQDQSDYHTWNPSADRACVVWVPSSSALFLLSQSS